MIFDKLCGIAERFLGDAIRKNIEQAALIEVPEVWEDTFARGVVISYQDIYEKFFLPFPVTCVEDPEGLVLFWWADNKDEHQPGLPTDAVLSCLVFRYAGFAGPAPKKDQGDKGFVPDKRTGILQVMHGFVTGFTLRREDELVLNTARTFGINKEGKPVQALDQLGGAGDRELIEIATNGLSMGWGTKQKFEVIPLEEGAGAVYDAFPHYRQLVPPFELQRRVKQDFLRACVVGLRQITLINHPGHWIVKTRGAEGVRRKPEKAKKIARSHERPRYLLITDEERVRYFRNDEPTEKRKSPVAHVRRAHFRKIGVEEASGKPVFTKVKAAWIGGCEATIRGVKYEVQLDL